MPAKLKTDLPDFTIFTDGKGRLCQVWRGKYYPEIDKGYFGKVHVLVWEFHNVKVPKGFHIHHIDGNNKNNEISNLACLDCFDHISLHSSKRAEEGTLGFQLMSGDNNPSKRPSQKALISEVQKNLVAEGNHYLQSPEARHSSSIRGKLLASQGLHPSQTTEFKEAQSKRASRASKRRAEEGSLFFQTADGIEKTRQRNKQLASEGRHPSQCEEFKKRASERVKNREFRLVICEECSKQFSTNALAKSKRCGSIECERSSNRKKTQRYRDRKKVTAND